MSKRVDLCPSRSYSDLYTGLWTVCFRKIGIADGAEMNAVVDAFGNTLKEAILYARQHMSNDIGFSWHSPVTKVTYCGQVNLLTMEPKMEMRSVVYNEGFFD